MITKRELHPSLVKEIESGGSGGTVVTGGGKVIQKKNTVTINAPASSINIGISAYDKTTDILLVFKNSVYLEEGVDYNISSNSSTITNTDGQWGSNNTQTMFNFIVLKNVPEMEDFDGRLVKENSISESKLDESVRSKLNSGGGGAVESLNGSKLVDNTVPESKLDASVRQKLNKELIVNELDGAKLVENTVPESKLNLNLKKKINKKIRSGYTNTLTKSYSKFARCVVPKPSGTVSLIMNFMSAENKKKYQSDGEVHYILTNDQGNLVNTILLESKNARNTKMNFCARKVSETSDSVVWELYVYCLQDHTKIDLNIINEYTSSGATLEFFQETAPLTKEQLHDLGGLVIWSQPKTFIETGSSAEDKVNYWAPFAEINYVEQWQGALCSLDIMDTNTVNPIKTGRLYIKSGQVQQLGNEPFVSMTLTGAVNLPKEYIKGVITKADGEMSTIKLFIKLDATYMTYLVKPDIDKSYEMMLIHNGEPVQSLPSGTQINCL